MTVCLKKLVACSGALLLAITLTVAVNANAEEPAAKSQKTVLITGSNRGIGLGFAKSYAAQGWKVIATCRKPMEANELAALAKADPDVMVEALDVTDPDEIDALAKKLVGHPIDVLINNAGIVGGFRSQSIRNMDAAEFERVLAVNTLGPLRVAEALLPNVAASQDKKIMNISTSEASFGQDRGPARIPFYRASKAALNMLMLNYAKMAAPEGIAVGLVNPGPVDTDMMKGVQMELRTVELAVNEMMTIIDQLSVENTGQFWNYDGKPLAW